MACIHYTEGRLPAFLTTETANCGWTKASPTKTEKSRLVEPKLNEIADWTENEKELYAKYYNDSGRSKLLSLSQAHQDLTEKQSAKVD